MSGRGTARPLGTRLLLWANVLAANAAAVVCVVTFVSPGALHLGIAPEEGYGGFGRVLVVPLSTTAAWMVFLGGLVLLLLELLWFVRRSRHPNEPQRYVISDAPGGAVRVSCEALETGLRQAGEALPEITRARIQVLPGGIGRKVRVLAWFNCPEGLSNLDASRLLRQALEQRFGSMVRLPDGSRAEFEIEFLGFAGKLARRAEEPAPPTADEGEDPTPFTGPRYPIPEDEDT